VKITYKNNHPRVAIRSEIEQVVYIHNRERVSEKQQRIKRRNLVQRRSGSI